MLNKQPLLLLLFLPPFLPPSPQSYLKLKFPYTKFYEIKITLIVRTLTINKKHTLCNNKIATPESRSTPFFHGTLSSIQI